MLVLGCATMAAERGRACPQLRACGRPRKLVTFGPVAPAMACNDRIVAGTPARPHCGRHMRVCRTPFRVPAMRGEAVRRCSFWIGIVLL